jgi:hypothetical protein
MKADRLTVICHFRNEKISLLHWLRHHTRLFDLGILERSGLSSIQSTA